MRREDADDDLREDADDDLLSVLAVMVGLDPLDVVEEAVAGSSDLGPREYICDRGRLVHVAGVPCWCPSWPVMAALAAPVHEGEWTRVHEWLYRRGLYADPMARDLDAEEARAA